jgi:hypothetical protein
MERPPYDPAIVEAIGDPDWCDPEATPGAAAAELELARAIHAGLDAALRQAAGEAAELRRSGHFSESGLHSELAERARAGRARIDDITAPLARLRDKRDALRRTSDAHLESTLGAVHPALVVRIWDWLPGDNVALNAEYLAAVARDDHPTVAAIEALPGFLEHALVDDQRAVGRAARFARHDQAAARMLEALERLVGDLERAQSGAAARLDRILGRPAIGDDG